MSLRFYKIEHFTTSGGRLYENLPVSYEVFGRPLHSAPVVLINHALTGNSDVAGPEKGWWKDLIGDGKLIDTQKYTVVAFNITGNGYDGLLIENYQDFTTKDIAVIFYTVLTGMGIDWLYAVLGGSLGGAIAWEIAALYPGFSKYIIPVATDCKATDWIIGLSSVQENILKNSAQPIQDARKMAMLLYRSAPSVSRKFNRTKTEDGTAYNVNAWLHHHGEKLKNRFDPKAYLMMNHLLSTTNIFRESDSEEAVFKKMQSEIIQIAVSSDLFFSKEENISTHQLLNQLGIPNQYFEIDSDDGHDAFLIETAQINNFLQPIFKPI